MTAGGLLLDRRSLFRVQPLSRGSDGNVNNGWMEGFNAELAEKIRRGRRGTPFVSFRWPMDREHSRSRQSWWGS